LVTKSRLKNLDLQDNDLSHEAGDALVDAITKTIYMQEISLSGNALLSHQVTEDIEREGIKNTQIEHFIIPMLKETGKVPHSMKNYDKSLI
jgi:Ran GTPase-activating protein (RanGAP) involved in mRNA processing and transport